MWIWLLAVFLLLAIWIGGYGLPISAKWNVDDAGVAQPFLPLAVCIVLTVVVLLLVVAWFVFKRWRAVQKARALEAEILKQAEQQAMNARPDRRAEILELQMQVQRGLQSLKTSRIGAARGGSALYSLPWYVIIGPPGAGKTTALKHSGLSFPLEGGGSIKGVGGTRNCDWWFTNEAILLDTAGRYATEADDHEEWLAFLGMLKKFRSKKPVNGVIVAISITDLMEATEEQIDGYAKKLRARVDEVMTRLQMVVPVYVMFTKTDLVAGFVEFWNDLRKSERAQIWGATFPLEGADTRDASKAFEEEFDGLVEAVHARAIKRIGAERQFDARQRIFQFPIEYQALRTNLSEFLRGLFERTGFQEAPIFRGLYFTSGTQEGRPIDRVIGGMMRAFNIAPAAVAEQPQTESKSYFVTDMFRKVVFPDQFVAARTRAEVRRQLLNRLAFAAVAMFLAALLLLPALFTFSQNKDLIAEVGAAAKTAQTARFTPQTVKANADLLAPLRDVLLEKLESDKNFLKWGWGMFVGRDLYVPSRQEYQDDMRAGFVVPVQASLVAQLEAVRDGRLPCPDAPDGRHVDAKCSITSENYGTSFNALKAYLESCDGVKQHREPYSTDGVPTWLVERLVIRWDPALEKMSPTDPDYVAKDAEMRELSKHVATYIRFNNEIAKEKSDAEGGEFKGAAPLWACDEDLKARVRQKFVDFKDRDYEMLVKDADRAPDITRSTMFANSTFAQDYISSKSKPEKLVHGRYTKAGWEAVKYGFESANVIKIVMQDSWVLSDTVDMAQVIERRVASLGESKNRYLAAYSREWGDFLGDLQVRTPQGRTLGDRNFDALRELKELRRPAEPRQLKAYEMLLTTLKENTLLIDPSEEVAAHEPSTLDKLKKAAEDKAKMSSAGQQANQLGLLPDGGAGPAAVVHKPLLPEQTWSPMWKFGEGDKEAPLAKYYDGVVNKLVNSLQRLSDPKEKGKGVVLTEVEKDFRDSMDAISNLLSNTGQTANTEPLLSSLLKNPIDIGYASVVSGIGGGAGGKWEIEVWKKWRAMEEKYPFSDSEKDVTLKDYSAFFKPQGGLLWAFYDKNLKGLLDLSGDNFEGATVAGHAVDFTPRFLKCYDRGLEITKTTFPEKGDAPVVEFSVNLHSVSENVSEVTFSIDGAERTYKNEPEEWLAVQWPAKEPKDKGAKVRIRGINDLDEEISRFGEFGFFRMLDAASRIEPGTEGGKRGAPPTIVVTWMLRSQGGVVQMDIRPSQGDNVFAWHVYRHQRLFRDYRCPRLMANLR